MIQRQKITLRAFIIPYMREVKVDNKNLSLSYIFNLPAILLALGEAIISSNLTTITHFGCLISGIKGDNIISNLLWLCNLLLGVQIT